MSFIFKLSKTILDLLIFSFILFVMFYCFCGITVFPEEMAVRQIDFGPYKGISKKILASGRVWNIPHYSKIYKIPTNIQILFLGTKNNDNESIQNSLKIQTLDGHKVSLNIYCLYRFSNLNPNGIYKLITQIGDLNVLWSENVKNTVESKLKESLETLSVNDFYNPLKKEKALSEAKNKINNILEKYGILMLDILIQKYSYEESEIDSEIFEKNIQEKDNELSLAKIRLKEIKEDIEGNKIRQKEKEVVQDGEYLSHTEIKNIEEINYNKKVTGKKKENNLKSFLKIHGFDMEKK